MSIAISSIARFVRVELPGIPEPVLQDAILKTTQKFFRDSGAWRHTVPTLLDWLIIEQFPTLVAGTDIPANTRVVRVDQLKFASDGVSLRKITFKTRGQLDAVLSNWEVKSASAPTYWTNEAGSPRIVPSAEADKTSTLQVRVIVAPNDSLTVLPDFLFYEFEDDFKNGTLARLMKIPGKDWTNLPAAITYSGIFESGITLAKSRAQADFGNPQSETSYGGI